MRILLTGGGTGGHLFPLIAVSRELKKIVPGMELFYIGPGNFGKELILKEGIQFRSVLAGKFRRYISFSNIVDVIKFPLGFLQSLWLVYFIMPDVIFGKGGYGSLPVCLAGWVYRIPILIHESDAVPGLTNRILSHFAKRISISFREVEKYFPEGKTGLAGNPIRPEILEGSAEEARQVFRLITDKPVLFVTGGSQGSRRINEVIIKNLPYLLEKWEIIHQCGERNYQDVKKAVDQIGGVLTEEIRKTYHLYPFLGEEMKHAYAVAHLIISRAGAGSIFEIAAWGKPSILVPFPGAAADHQKANAYSYARFGTTVVLEEANLTEHILREKISYLREAPELLKKMGERARQFYKPNAAKDIAEDLVKLMSS